MARGTRSSMVRSAAALLRQEGVRGTSFGRVLDHSGAPRGSIAHHFPGGKDELMREALVASSAEITKAIDGLRGHGATAAHVVEAMCDYFAAELDATGWRSGCPVAAVAMEAHDHPALRSEAAQILAGWRRTLVDLLVEQGVDRDTAIELTELGVAAVEGALISARLQRSRAPLDAVSRQLAALLRASTHA